MSDAPNRKERSIGKHIARGSAWAMMMRGGLRAIGLVNTIILARLLLPEDFGLIAMAALCLGLLETFTELGVGLHLIRTPQATREHCDTATTIRLIKGFLVATMLAAGAPLAAQYFNDPRVVPLVQVLALVAIINGTQSIGMVLVRRDLDFAKDFRFVIYGRLFNFFITVTLAFFLRSYWAIAIAQVASAAFDVLLSFRMHPYRPALSLVHAREYLRFALHTIPFGIANYLNLRLHTLVVGRLGTASTLGIYNVASELAETVTDELVTQLARALFPSYARVASDRELLADTLLSVVAWAAVIGMPLAIGLSAVADDAVHLVFGSRWSAAVFFLQWLAIASLARSLASMLGGQVLIAAGREGVAVALTWSRLALLAPAAIVAGMLWGVQGVAVAVTVAYVLHLPIVAAVVARVLSISVGRIVRVLWRPLLAATAMAATIAPLHGMLAEARWMTLLIDVVTGSLVYVLLLAVLWYLSGRPPGPERTVLEFIRRVESRVILPIMSYPMPNLAPEAPFHCPSCQAALIAGVESSTCSRCGARYARRDGILDLRVHRHDYYFNPVPRDEMVDLVSEAATVPWDHTLGRFLRHVRNVPDWIDNLAVNGRYSWKLLLALPAGGRFLDFGCGLGNLTQNIAGHVGEVVALDLTWERLRFAQQRSSHFNRDARIRFVAAGDGPHLPFPDAHFDTIALSGVLEWIADDIDTDAFTGSRGSRGLRMLLTFFGDRNPYRRQRRFLAELRRILKPDGQLFVAIENRWGYEYFLGRPDHHSGLPGGSLLPRFLANAYSIVRKHKPYRTYTHSYLGLGRLFRSAGFPCQQVYGLTPGYSGLAEVVPARRYHRFWKPALRASVAARLKYSRYFVPAFGIVAQPSGEKRVPLLGRLLEAISEAVPHLGELTIHDWQVTGKDKVVLTASTTAGAFVLRLPAGSDATESETTHRDFIRMLSNASPGRSPAPEPIADGLVQGVRWFLERRLPGVPLNRALRLSREAAAAGVVDLVKTLATNRSTDVRAAREGLRARIDEGVNRLASAGGFVPTELVSELRASIDRNIHRAGLEHGDLSVSNLFVDGDSIVGVIDWEYARISGVPALDMIAYLESRERMAERKPTAGATLLRLARLQWTCEAELVALRQVYASNDVPLTAHSDICKIAGLVHTSHRLATTARLDPRVVEALACDLRKLFAV